MPGTIPHSATGLVVPLPDPGAVGEPITTPSRDPDPRRRMATREWVTTHVDIAITIGRIEELCQQLLEEKLGAQVTKGWSVE